MKLLVLTPSKGSVGLEHRNMLLRLEAAMIAGGHKLVMTDDTTSGMLAHSRAALLYQLATSNCDRGLWLDSDVYFDHRAILRCMQRPEDVIVWGYPVRIGFDIDYPPESRLAYAAAIRAQPYRRWTITPRLDSARIVRSADGRLVELLQCGLGACLMSRQVAADMHDGHGPHQLDADKRVLSWAFEPLPETSERISEDISFWRRLRKRGHQIWCDPAPYVTNGQSGGRFEDEIRLREATMPWLCAQAFVVA